MLSSRGSIAVDDRTNTLLIQDTAERLQDVRRMVRTLDIPIKQVLIESRIVVVNDDFSRDFGVRLGVTAADWNGSNTTTVISPAGQLCESGRPGRADQWRWCQLDAFQSRQHSG